jgi:hypothetical protein
MAEPKTQITDASVEAFLAGIEPPARAEEARALDALFRRVSGADARMWGANIIGYGEYRATYDSGRKVHWMRSGFSPRKAQHVLYLAGGYCDDVTARGRDDLLVRLGKHGTGKSCLYIKRLADIDLGVLEAIVAADWQAMLRLHPES